MNELGRFGKYNVSEDFVAKIIRPTKEVLADDGSTVKEQLRVRLTKRILTLVHFSTGDRVVFTIGKFGKRIVYRDSREPKKTFELKHCLPEICRMLGVDLLKAAELLAPIPQDRKATAEDLPKEE